MSIFNIQFWYIFSSRLLQITILIFISIEALGQNNYWERFPSVSPDGRYIVYESTKYGRPEILIIDYNGSTSGRITDDDAIDGNPSWSPDGEQIIYYSTFDNTHDNFIQNFDIYLYDLNDSTSINLTKNAFFDVAPAWSLDGNHVYYNTERDSSEQLMRLNLITGSDQIIMDKIEHHNAISISPDNQMFLAITYGNDGNWDVSVFDFKSLEKIRSFQHPAREGQPLWSPDGSKITFSSKLQ